MELGAAALADRLERDRDLWRIPRRRRGQNRNFLHLVLVDVGGLRPLVAGSSRLAPSDVMVMPP
jgi:hypothetical protein